MRRHRAVLLGVVATLGGCTAPTAAVEEPMVAAETPDAGPTKPCTWKAGNSKMPPCTD